jgi:probable HAF family extracellular repeat protein
MSRRSLIATRPWPRAGDPTVHISRRARLCRRQPHAPGDLPGGSFNSVANGVSADGSVVVGNSFSRPPATRPSAGRATAAWWDWATCPAAGSLATPAASAPTARLSSGAAALLRTPSELPRPSAGRARRHGRLGDLPGGEFHSVAIGVSADGSVIVGPSDSASGYEAFRWTSDGGMVGLGDLPGGWFQSRPTASAATARLSSG